MHRSFTRLKLAIAILLLLGLHGAPQAQGQQNHTVFLPFVSSESGTRVVGGSSIQDALDAAQPGDIILLEAKTYTADLKIERSGNPGAPIIIRGAGRGQTTLSGAIVISGAAHVVVEDLDIDANSDDDAIRIEAPAQFVTLQRLHLYSGSSYGVRIDTDVHDVLIQDSEINGFDAGSSDAHGVGIETASNITIRRCNIYGNSGDAIQSNTPDYPGYNRYASNIIIEDNDLHDNRENAVDIKSTHGIVVRNNRMWGTRVVSSSDGMALQIQYGAEDVTITGNQIWDAVQGIEITRGKKSGQEYPLAPKRVTIAGNLIHDIIAQGSDSGSGSALIVRSSSDVKVYNNTVQRAAGAGLYISYSNENDLPGGVDVRNNVLDGATNDLYFARDPELFQGLVVDYNHYEHGTIRGDSLADWLLLGFERHPTSGDAGLSTAFLPLPASALIDSGADVGLPFSGAAPDRGWGELAP
jgi:parallel beta-helix repeat protein